MSEPNPNNQNQNQEPAGGAAGGSQQPAIDYDKLAEVVAGKQKVAGEKAMKSFLSDQGLSADEMAEAIKTFKEQRAKNTPDPAKLQSDLTAANTAKLQAVINQAATLEAVKQGVDVKSIPYLLKLADFKNVIGDDGGINAEKLTEAITTVLTDIPAFKADTNAAAGGVHKIGGDNQSQQRDDSPKADAPRKRWNRFNY